MARSVPAAASFSDQIARAVDRRTQTRDSRRNVRGLPAATITKQAVNETREEVSFEMFARRFVERYSKDRGKASWQDDQYMVKRVGSFSTIDGRPLGEKPVQRVTEDDLEGFIKHLTTQGRASSTRNHYVQLIRAMSRWAVKKGYRDTSMVGDDSDVIRRKKEAQRDRRLEPGEEDKLLRSAGPHLQALIIAALETARDKASCSTCGGATYRLHAGRSSSAPNTRRTARIGSCQSRAGSGKCWR